MITTTERASDRATRTSAADELLQQLLEVVDETLANASFGSGVVVCEDTFRDSETFCDDDASDGERPLFGARLDEDGDSAFVELTNLTERPRGHLAVAISAGNVIVLAVLVALLIKSITTAAVLCLAVSGLFLATAALFLSLRSKCRLNAAVGEQMTLMMDSLVGDGEIDFGREDELELLYRETRSGLAAAIDERLERCEESLRKESLREVVAVRARCEALVDKHVQRVHEQNAALEAELRALRAAPATNGGGETADTPAARETSGADASARPADASKAEADADSEVAEAPGESDAPQAEVVPQPVDVDGPAEATEESSAPQAAGSPQGNAAPNSKHRSRKKRKRNRRRS